MTKQLCGPLGLVRSVRIFATLAPGELSRASGDIRIIVEEVGGGESVVNKTAFMKERR